MLARFGLDRSTIAVGIEIRDDVVLLALTRQNRRVVGLGYMALSAGAVVRGDVREPGRLGAGLADLLRELHAVRSPRVAVSLVPAVPQSGQTVAAETDIGGTVHALSRAVDAARPLATSIGELSHVESTPISLARFGRLARPEHSDMFLRGGAAEGRWTAQLHDGTFEVELDQRAPRPATPTIGPDLASLDQPRWGAIDLARDLRRTDSATAASWAVAVGASFGALGVGPVIDLAAASDAEPAAATPSVGWTIEQIDQIDQSP